MPFPAGEVARRLLAWYGEQGRDLPWRRTRDPYRIWLSEIMLQQTTVAAVIPYYDRFLARFPTLASLAAADLESVLELWAGLGYYSRARNLHAAARQAVDQHGGRFPANLEDLCALPGIGRSTAGAILSIAFDRPAPILDGNVRRVLVRLFAWTEDPRSSRAERQLWQWATALTPTTQAHAYAQAIMDLGATVCTPRTPGCAACPLAALCRARRLGLATELPVRHQRKPVPVRRQAALLVTAANGRLMVRRRPLERLLGGLWEFPVTDLDDHETAAEGAARLRQELGVPEQPMPLGSIQHAYSHFRLELSVLAAGTASACRCAEDHSRWVAPETCAGLPLHGAHLKALDLFLQQANTGGKSGNRQA